MHHRRPIFNRIKAGDLSCIDNFLRHILCSLSGVIGAQNGCKSEHFGGGVFKGVLEGGLWGWVEGVGGDG